MRLNGEHTKLGTVDYDDVLVPAIDADGVYAVGRHSAHLCPIQCGGWQSCKSYSRGKIFSETTRGLRSRARPGPPFVFWLLDADPRPRGYVGGADGKRVGG